MDRQMLTYVAVTIFALTLIGGWYLGARKPRVGATVVSAVSTEAVVEPNATREYSPDDVRYKFEQKARKQGKRRAAPVADQPTPPPEENEAAPVDDGGDETAEEPPLD